MTKNTLQLRVHTPKRFILRDDFHHRLARIRTMIKTHQALRCGLQATFDDVFFALELSLCQPGSQVF